VHPIRVFKIAVQRREVQMGSKNLMTAVSLALFFFAVPHAAHAQKHGEAQAVVFDANDRPTLIFANKPGKKVQSCGALVSYTLLDNQEEAIVARVSHLHVGSLGMRPVMPESGWLYITEKRIVFSVEVGDKSHGFDLPRAKFKDEAATSLGSRVVMSLHVGMRLNLKEKLQPSDSDTQKFVFFLAGSKRCDTNVNTDPYTRFMKLAVNDFKGAVAELKQLADSLKQAGKFKQTQASVFPSDNSKGLPDPISDSPPEF
jgi:hypothetical protein